MRVRIIQELVMNRRIRSNVLAALVGAALLGTACKPVTAAAPAGESAESNSFSGKVVETMNAATYTYILVDTGKDKKWAAAPQFEVKTGDTVTVTRAMGMPNYHSKTLQRDFDIVYFTGSVAVAGKAGAAAEQALPKDHPQIGHGQMNAGAPMSFAGLKKAEGGQTVEEIVGGSAALKGKSIKVRGKVVKYNAMVLGKNWMHIRDGSGAEGRNDLTVTTQTAAKVGDTVLVTGTVSTDRDFGSGYRYAVIVEDAKVTVEEGK